METEKPIRPKEDAPIEKGGCMEPATIILLAILFSAAVIIQHFLTT